MHGWYLSLTYVSVYMVGLGLMHFWRLFFVCLRLQFTQYFSVARYRVLTFVPGILHFDEYSIIINPLHIALIAHKISVHYIDYSNLHWLCIYSLCWIYLDLCLPIDVTFTQVFTPPASVGLIFGPPPPFLPNGTHILVSCNCVSYMYNKIYIF